MNRRVFGQLLLASGGFALGGLLPPVLLAASYSRGDLEAMRDNWRDYLPADFAAPDQDDKLSLSESEWRERLTEREFDILREEGTERAFSSPLDKETRRGVFVCAGCSLPLFTSAMKFDSGTGWPSFVTSIPGAFETKRDFILLIPRTEYHCTRCGGHNGHVFDDGPPPLGERWCSNGLALEFIPASGEATASTA